MPLSVLYLRFAARAPDAVQRSPLLERLIARAGAPARVQDWRIEALRLLAPDANPPPPLAAAIAPQSGTDPRAVWACIATPVHLVAGMRGVTMGPDGMLNLAPEEAVALSDDFNRVFEAGGMRLSAGRGARLACLFDAPIDAVTRDPDALAGIDVFGFQPTGPDGPRLRRLMSEMEMWLFDHPVNAARAAKGLRAVTALWLWGGGAAGQSVPPLQGWCAGEDPFFGAFGNVDAYPGPDRSGVVVCAGHPGSDEWPDVERRWLAPAVAGLRSGRLERLELSAAERRFSVASGPHWRFWRRPRPWWESYGVE
jgi:hypothetical protein